MKLLESEKAVVEGAGATGFAAILSGLLPELKGKKLVFALCLATCFISKHIKRQKTFYVTQKSNKY